jgi:hypothetical protein
VGNEKLVLEVSARGLQMKVLRYHGRFLVVFLIPYRQKSGYYPDQFAADFFQILSNSSFILLFGAT